MTATAASGHPNGRWEVATRGPRLRDDARAMEDVDTALRHLVAACREARRPLPVMPALTVGGGIVEAHLAAPMGRAPAPWRTRRHVWSVDVDELGDVPPQIEAYPALVPLGSFGPDRHLLADLAAAPGLIEVDGGADEVDAFLGRVARNLLLQPWSTGTRVTVVGQRVLDHPRARCVRSLTEAVDAGPPEPGGVTGRWGPAPREAHEVVVMTRRVDRAERRLAQSASRMRNAPTVIAPGPGDAAWSWHVHEGTVTW